jgi:rhodanese-related sulfurtransferase
MFDIFNSLFGGGSDDLSEAMTESPFLVDVREPSEFKQGHPKGSVNIPLNQIEAQLDKFKGHKSIVVFCRSGNRSGIAKSILEARGFSHVYNGGTWQNVSAHLN